MSNVDKEVVNKVVVTLKEDDQIRFIIGFQNIDVNKVIHHLYLLKLSTESLEYSLEIRDGVVDF